MLVMDCRLAILTNKLIKSQATISIFFLRGGNPPQTPPGLRGIISFPILPKGELIWYTSCMLMVIKLTAKALISVLMKTISLGKISSTESSNTFISNTLIY